MSCGETVAKQRRQYAAIGQRGLAERGQEVCCLPLQGVAIDLSCVADRRRPAEP